MAYQIDMHELFRKNAPIPNNSGRIQNESDLVLLENKTDEFKTYLNSNELFFKIIQIVSSRVFKLDRL